MTTRARRVTEWVSLLFVLGICRLALGHPMGNFSVNHYSRITVEGDRFRIRYFIDLAEIPTYQELQEANISSTSIDPDAGPVLNYVKARGAELARGLLLDVDGKPLNLRLVSSGVIFPPGAGGLPTMKMGFVYEAAYLSTPASPRTRNLSIHYSDKNYPGHSGWKEIVAVASAGSILRSSVPTADRSAELSNYPTDLLTSPPQDLEASFNVALNPPATETSAQPLPSSRPTRPYPAQTGTRFTPAKDATLTLTNQAARHPEPVPSSVEVSPRMRLQGNLQQTPRSRFTELIQAQNLSAWFLFTAALIAIGLGGLHALEPGHGKTVVAAYLVGSKGTPQQAFLLGLIVTVSHTAGVFALGAVTLYASRYIVPEHLYPWMGALSGVTIAGLGIFMVLRRLTGTAVDHSHAPGSSQAHWGFLERLRGENAARREPVSDVASPSRRVGLPQLFMLGITGGIIPCPAALVVLLSAFALHRIGFGFFLIVAFSVGLASVLISFGMAMVYARRFMGRFERDGSLTKRWLPVVSSSFITILGLILAVQSLASAHLDVQPFSSQTLGPVLFVTVLGLILGMRHSTDADHVVAISTIVSRQRSIRNAAVIGSIWGLGHTLTIFIVGSLIILFGVEIPPRLGLSMEFSVAIMLVVLGILNLTGVMQSVTARFTPAVTKNNQTTESRSATSPRIESILERSVGRLGLYQCIRPLVIGLVHGLAGSAAVALLVLSTIHNPIWATAYLLIFGAGTMVGMMGMTAMIAVPLAFAGDRFARLGKYLGTASGMASLCFGSFLVYQLGFLGGLFTTHPQWIPH